MSACLSAAVPSGGDEAGVVILGNGAAGVAAAARLRARDGRRPITLVSGECDYHYSRPALMYVFMGHMRFADTKPYPDECWDSARIARVRGWVVRIDAARKRLHFADGRELTYDQLVLATGSRPNRFGWPGQDLPGVQGFYSLQDLALLEENLAGCRRAVIVGGGLIGIELAEMLHSRGVAVTFLVRETSYWNNIIPEEESRMIGRVIRDRGLGLVLETHLKEIVDDGTGRARAVITEFGERIECQVVGLTAGVAPNLSALDGSGIPTRRGVLVDASFRTRVPDVYAVGDCAEIVPDGGESGFVEQLWYTARAQGEVLGEILAGDARRYERGVFFNSAKFFHLEYQTYGTVPPNLPGGGSLYWESPDHEQAVRIVHAEGAVIGVNVMGVRYRHRICERWIAERRPVADVVARLSEAGFDPEFSRRHAAAAANAFRAQLAGVP